MKKQDGKLIFWPAYFEKNISRSQGRKIPSNLAAPDVTINLLEEAAESAGLEYEIDVDRQYPRYWSVNRGYIVVDNDEGHKKKRLMLTLAKGIRRAVAKRESARLAQESKKSKKKHRKR
jgi:signal recognition particle subunit SRP19